jgi:hypothetical protein
VIAAEGLWRAGDLPALHQDVRAQGFRRGAERIPDRQELPLRAAIQGISGGFVSPDGLIATCHHCIAAYFAADGSAFPNYIPQAFIARTRSEERPARGAPSLFILEDERDITEELKRGTLQTSGFAESQARLATNRSAVLSRCEAVPDRRCKITSDAAGEKHWLQTLFEIKDIRLVYTPSSQLGNFGWRRDLEYRKPWWPAYRGDFAFIRAYVAPDGSSASYSAKNVPYRPKCWLKISRGGVTEGETVTSIGVPHATQRWATAVEAELEFGALTEARIEDWQAFGNVLGQMLLGNGDAKSRYREIEAYAEGWPLFFNARRIAARKVGLLALKREDERAFREWAARNPQWAHSARALDRLEGLVTQDVPSRLGTVGFAALDRIDALYAARTLYRWAQERPKADFERAQGFQDRDRPQLVVMLSDAQARYLARVDRLLFEAALRRYRRSTFKGTAFLKAVEAIGLRQAYTESNLLQSKGDVIEWLDRPIAAIEASPDPFFRIAQALEFDRRRLEAEFAPRSAAMEEARAEYRQGLLAYAEDRGRRLYSEADDTLRISVGQVSGRSSDRGNTGAFSTGAGLVATNTGKADLAGPPQVLEKLRTRDYGAYAFPGLGLPVDFQSTADCVSGNSGSIVLNGGGELVGIVSNRSKESVISEWRYVPQTHRTLQTDIRFVLWMLDKVEGANHVMDELTYAD